MGKYKDSFEPGGQIYHGVTEHAEFRKRLLILSFVLGGLRQSISGPSFTMFVMSVLVAALMLVIKPP